MTDAAKTPAIFWNEKFHVWDATNVTKGAAYKITVTADGSVAWEGQAPKQTQFTLGPSGSHADEIIQVAPGTALSIAAV